MVSKEITKMQGARVSGGDSSLVYRAGAQGLTVRLSLEPHNALAACWALLCPAKRGQEDTQGQANCKGQAPFKTTANFFDEFV